MVDRILLLLKSKNISASKFADEIGVQRSGISHIISGRNNPSLELIQKILKRYADINPTWLITGSGSMSKLPDLFSIDESFDKTPISVQKIESKPSKEKISKETVNEYMNLSTKESTDDAFSNNASEVPLEKQSLLTKQEDKPEEKKLPVSKSPKVVEKAIFFYTDKTFSVYTPEK